MCYNGKVESAPPDELPKLEEMASQALRWQRKLEDEKAMHAGTWAYMRHYDKLLKDVRLALDDPCEGCACWEQCPGECPALDRIRDIVYGRNG